MVYEVRWNDGMSDEDIVEQFTDLREAQDKVREVDAKFGMHPLIWTVK